MGGLALEADGLRLIDRHDVEGREGVHPFALLAVRESRSAVFHGRLGERGKERLPRVVGTIFEKWVGVQGCGSVGDWCLQ